MADNKKKAASRPIIAPPLELRMYVDRTQFLNSYIIQLSTICHACCLHLLRWTGWPRLILRVSPDMGIRSRSSGLCTPRPPQFKTCVTQNPTKSLCQPSDSTSFNFLGVARFARFAPSLVTILCPFRVFVLR